LHARFFLSWNYLFSQVAITTVKLISLKKKKRRKMKELAMKKKHRVISDSTPSYAPDPSKSHYTEQFGSLAFHVFLEFHFCTRCLIMILCIASPVLLCFLPYYFFLLTSPSHFPQISLSSYSSSFPVSSPLQNWIPRLKKTPSTKFGESKKHFFKNHIGIFYSIIINNKRKIQVFNKVTCLRL